MYKAASQAADIKEELKKKKMLETLKKQELRNEGGEKTEKYSKKSDKTSKKDIEPVDVTQ